MIVAISSTGTSLDSNVDARFGRCSYFIFYDTDTDRFDSIDNQSRNSMEGAGIQTAQMVANKGAKAIITGNVGPNAFRVLYAAGVKIYSGASGKVSEAIEKFKSGGLTETSSPDVGSHFGMSRQ